VNCDYNFWLESGPCESTLALLNSWIPARRNPKWAEPQLSPFPHSCPAFARSTASSCPLTPPRAETLARQLHEKIPMAHECQKNIFEQRRVM